MFNPKSLLKLVAGSSLCLLFLAGGCDDDSDPVDSIDTRVDCSSICSRYADCFDSNYDQDACEDRCQNNADSDPDYQGRVDACDACIDDRACSEATFNCANSCGSVVP